MCCRVNRGWVPLVHDCCRARMVPEVETSDWTELVPGNHVAGGMRALLLVLVDFLTSLAQESSRAFRLEWDLETQEGRRRQSGLSDHRVEGHGASSQALRLRARPPFARLRRTRETPATARGHAGLFHHSGRLRGGA
jgi:hypothetical protein